MPGNRLRRRAAALPGHWRCVLAQETSSLIRQACRFPRHPIALDAIEAGWRSPLERIREERAAAVRGSRSRVPTALAFGAGRADDPEGQMAGRAVRPSVSSVPGSGPGVWSVLLDAAEVHVLDLQVLV